MATGRQSLSRIPFLFTGSAGSYGEHPNIGRQRLCDIGHIEHGQPFWVQSEHGPPDLDLTVTQENPIRITLEASGDNAVSMPLVIEISWNGQWHDDDGEMAKHLVLREIVAT